MLASKLTAKYQATVPAEIRKKLGVGKGDLLGFEIVNDKVTVCRVTPLDVAFSKALTETLDEWNTPNDEEAYRGL